MGYGPNKYTGAQFIQGILDHIKSRLDQQGEFQNNSLGYYGVEFNYKLEIKLLARGETHLLMPGHGSLIAGTDTDPLTPDPDALAAAITSTDEDVKDTVTVAGGSSAGTGTRTQLGDHKQADPDRRLHSRENVKGGHEKAALGKGVGAGAGGGR